MKKYILFVCGHNSGRSQMAEVYFNTYNNNLEIEAFSAGTALKGDGQINPKVVKLLQKKGIDIFNQPKKYGPKILTPEILKNAYKVYTMGCMDGCMVGNRKADFDFGLDDPAEENTDLEKMWSDFEGKIKKLAI